MIAFTAHHVIAAEIDESTIRQRIDPSDLSQPMSAGFLLFLAGWLGADPGPIDVLFVAPPAGGDLELWRATTFTIIRACSALAVTDQSLRCTPIASRANPTVCS